MAIKVEDLDLEQRELLLNGCGPVDKLWGWFEGPDLIFKECCDNHDLAYRVGGEADMWKIGKRDSTDRYMADLAFYSAMKKKAAKQSWYIRWVYYRAARFYFDAVVAFGQAYFVFRERGEAQLVTVSDLVAEEHARLAAGKGRWASACCACREDAER